MSISATLANALTGLAAASRSAQIVSSNVANAMTDGYARREIALSPNQVGGDGAGVQIDGVQRAIDENLLRELRLASASVGSAGVPARFHQDVLDLMGMPSEASSLSARLAGFETALLDATSRPESDARLTAVLEAAASLAGKLNDVSDGVQGLREDVTAERPETLELIRRHIDLLDDALRRQGFSDLNFSFDQNGGDDPPERIRKAQMHAGPPPEPDVPPERPAEPRRPEPAANGRVDLRL